MKTESQVRKKAETALRRQIPEIIWARLVERRYVSEALELGEKGFQSLLDEARFLIGLMGSGRDSPPSTGEQRGKASLADYEKLRARAFSEYLAKALGPLVGRLRLQSWGGDPLSEKDASTLLGSPAAQAFSPDDFRSRRIPVIGHQAEFKGPGLIFVKPPGRTFKVSGSPDRWGPSSAVWPGSMIDLLCEASRGLQTHLPWEEKDALWFLLTGKVPRIEPIKVRTRILQGFGPEGIHTVDGPITLTIEPWASASSVLRTYQKTQRRLPSGSSRPPGERNLEVFRHVTEKTDDSSGRPSWTELMESWNRKQKTQKKNWSYTDRRQFRRDYHRAKDVLVPKALRQGMLTPFGIKDPDSK